MYGHPLLSFPFQSASWTNKQFVKENALLDKEATLFTKMVEIYET